ncbi:hypothetical protein ANCCAN_26223 [Ancylostoma caninum]|uniref:Uncharacterized protein n=1 Tax=Ancylostoma caninum TaxID=29170 RepID=A0A368FAM4_ANCCA|nr:hypothetical protein ANCCAN_26223 [Ancylostoma caninum]
MTKELETVHRMTRTGWLLIFNLLLSFGVSEGVLQGVMEKLGCRKPLFDCDRDLLVIDMTFFKGLCNISVRSKDAICSVVPAGGKLLLVKIKRSFCH